MKPPPLTPYKKPDPIHTEAWFFRYMGMEYGPYISEDRAFESLEAAFKSKSCSTGSCEE